jgi:glycosyltransferase involved in cell wall biosynthesis
VSALNTLLKDPGIIMGQNGYQRVNDYFSWEQVAAKTSSLLISMDEKASNNV